MPLQSLPSFSFLSCIFHASPAYAQLLTLYSSSTNSLINPPVPISPLAVLSDSDVCRHNAANMDADMDVDVDLDADADVEYQYSPLDGDSDVEESSTLTSDESIALLAHEMLCCEHDSDTDTEAETDTDDVDVDDDVEVDIDVDVEVDVDVDASEADDANDANDADDAADGDDDDDEDVAETEPNYALLMCSEDDEDFERQQLLHSKQLKKEPKYLQQQD